MGFTVHSLRFRVQGKGLLSGFQTGLAGNGKVCYRVLGLSRKVLQDSGAHRYQ